MTMEIGRKSRAAGIVVAAAILSCGALARQSSDDAVPPERANFARVDKLLAQMTLEEKMDLIRGDAEPAATNQGQAGYLPGVPRLGIPPLRMADGPPGVLTRVACTGANGNDGRGRDLERQGRGGRMAW